MNAQTGGKRGLQISPSRPFLTHLITEIGHTHSFLNAFGLSVKTSNFSEAPIPPLLSGRAAQPGASQRGLRKSEWLFLFDPVAFGFSYQQFSININRRKQYQLTPLTQKIISSNNIVLNLPSQMHSAMTTRGLWFKYLALNVTETYGLQHLRTMILDFMETYIPLTTSITHL